jgi:hypothetical protein
MLSYIFLFVESKSICSRVQFCYKDKFGKNIYHLATIHEMNLQEKIKILMFHCWFLLLMNGIFKKYRCSFLLMELFLKKNLSGVVVIRVWVWRRGSSRKMMDVERKHTLNGDLKFAKVIGLNRELTKWNYRIKKWWTTCASRRDVVFHTIVVIYNATHAKNKKTAYKVQDAFNNKFGTIINIY